MYPIINKPFQKNFDTVFMLNKKYYQNNNCLFCFSIKTFSKQFINKFHSSSINIFHNTKHKLQQQILISKSCGKTQKIKGKRRGFPLEKNSKKHTTKVKQVLLHLLTEIRRTNRERVSRCRSDVISCVIDEIISFSRFVLSWTVETCPKSCLSSSFATHLDFSTIIVWSPLPSSNKKTNPLRWFPHPGRLRCPALARVSTTRHFKLHVETLSQRVSQFCKLGGAINILLELKVVCQLS